MDLIREKNKDPAIKARKVYFSYTITPERTQFAIRDEGDGFDWRTRLAAKRGHPGLHGMGMKMANLYVQRPRLQRQGQRGLLRDLHHQGESNTIPKIFDQSEELVFQDGQYICSEGEEIGLPLLHRLGHASTCTPRASSSRRSRPTTCSWARCPSCSRTAARPRSCPRATSVLIKISKQDFVNLIKENPHYGIFLARLLAQRLARLNARTARLNTEYLKLKDCSAAGTAAFQANLGASCR